MANPLLALSIQQPDVTEGFREVEAIKSNRLRDLVLNKQLAKADRDEASDNKLRAFYAENGPALAAGDQNALDKLAALSPDKALDIRKTQSALTKDKMDIFGKQAEAIQRHSAGIMAAPPAVRPMLYARGLADMKAAGFSVQGAPEEYDENFVKSQAMSAADFLKMRTTMTPEQAQAAGLPKGTVAQTGPLGDINVISKPAEYAPPELTRLQAIRDKLPASDPRRAEIDAAIKKQTALPKGTRVQLADGSTIEVGGVDDGGTGLAKPTINDIEGQALNASMQLSRLSQIDQSFKPEFLEILPRAGASWNAIKEKAGVGLAPEAQQQLQDFTKFRRDTIENVNKTIKDITGAAMSVPEAERIMKQVPNAGTGVFDGDSPTEFKAKMKGATDAARNALLRANWARVKGLNPLKSGIEIEEVPKLVEKRGAEIEKALRKIDENATDDVIRQQVRLQLGKEFGMTQ